LDKSITAKVADYGVEQAFMPAIFCNELLGFSPEEFLSG